MPARVATVLIVAVVACAGSVFAQGALTGTVRHDSTGAPLAGVEVLINGTTHRTETNAQGRYLLTGLPTGTHQAIFRKVGYLPVRIDVRLTAGDTTRANTPLIESAVVLAPVIVTGRPETTRGVGIGREAFEERRKMGFGVFFDSAEVRRSEHLRLEDLLRRHAGIELRHMSIRGFRNRWAALSGRRGGCFLQVWFDGIKIGQGGALAVRDTADLTDFSLSSLESVEVYRSTAQVPQEFGGASAGCGVLLLWSRRGS